MIAPDYIRVTHAGPHASRGRQLLAAHPELRAMSICKHHLLHHRHQGEIELDADIAAPADAGIVGQWWSRLPQLGRIAPEFYDDPHADRSWTALLVAFLRDRRITLFSRVVRPLH